MAEATPQPSPPPEGTTSNPTIPVGQGQRELRLALGMRGGVSLAIWMGGACAEIDALRRGEGFWGKLLEQSNYRSVSVDVMAGASAGGLNGVLLAAAIRHGFPMSSVFPVWLKVGDVGALLREDAPWISIFDGDEKFLEVVAAELDALISKARDEDAREDAWIDLQVTATLVEPTRIAATSPSDEPLSRTRSAARFHFRQDPTATPSRDDMARDQVRRLALAARSTASFPFALEPAVVRSTRPPAVTLEPGPVGAATARRTDCRGVFSESRGQGPADGRAADEADDPAIAQDFVVADGGIVDNIPLGKALEAIRDAPADGPTKRVLVYLHPTGPSIARSQATVSNHPIQQRRSPTAMAAGMLAARVQGESIVEDLDALEAHNQRVRTRLGIRKGLAKELCPVPSEGQPPPEPSDEPSPEPPKRQPPPVPWELARDRLVSYAQQRAASDALDVHDLLRDPTSVLGEDPFPFVPGSDDRWLAPLAGWTRADREGLVGALEANFRAGLDTFSLEGTPTGARNSVLHGGLGPLTRVATYLIELARGLQHSPSLGSEADAAALADIASAKAELYRLLAAINELDRWRRIGWVVAAGTAPSAVLPADGTVPGGADADGTAKGIDAWVNVARLGVDGLLRCASADSTDVGAQVATMRDPAASLLQSWVDGTPEAAEVGQDIRSSIIAGLVQAATLLAGPATTALEPEEPQLGSAEAIARVLGPTPTAKDLASLEVLMFPESLVGWTAGSEIEFTRLSAAAETIHAERFAKLWNANLELVETIATSSGGTGSSAGAGPEATSKPDHLLPDVKLAGNELASFSGFLDARWRANDWAWGTMDAVPTLVDLVLETVPGADPDTRAVPEGRIKALVDLVGDEAWCELGVDPKNVDPTNVDRVTLRRALILERQLELSNAAASGAAGLGLGPPARWQAGLETLTHPGDDALAKKVGRAADNAALVAAMALPASAPRVDWLLRWGARIASSRFAEPQGGLPAAPGSAPSTKPSGWFQKLKAKAASKVADAWPCALVVVVAVIAALAVWALVDSTVSAIVGGAAGLLVPLAVMLAIGRHNFQLPKREP